MQSQFHFLVSRNDEERNQHVEGKDESRIGKVESLPSFQKRRQIAENR